MPSPNGEVLRAANVVLHRIVTGNYPPGLRLPPEHTLSAELGCARGTLREALSQLAALGLVSSRKGSGVLVLDFRTEGTMRLLPEYIAAGQFDHPLSTVISELLYVRRFLAAEAARLAAQYATHESLEPVRKLITTLDQHASDAVSMSAWEFEFYRALVQSSAMWPAVWLANSFLEPMRELTAQFAPVGEVPEGLHDLIDRVMALVEARRPEQASAVVRRHFEALDTTLLSRIELLLSDGDTAVVPGRRNDRRPLPPVAGLPVPPKTPRTRTSPQPGLKP